MFPDLRLRHLSFEYPGSAGAGPRHLPGLFSPQPHSLIPTQPPLHLQGLCTCCGLCQTHSLIPTATRSKAPPAQTALPPGSPPSREPSLISRDVSSPGQARRAHPLHSHDAGVFSSAELYGPGDKATLGVGDIWHASQPSGRLGTGSDCWGEDVEKWRVRWAHHFLHVCRWGSSPNSSTVYRGGGCDD